MRLTEKEWKEYGTLKLALPRLKTDKVKAEVKVRIQKLEDKVTKQ